MGLIWKWHLLIRSGLIGKWEGPLTLTVEADKVNLGISECGVTLKWERTAEI